MSKKVKVRFNLGRGVNYMKWKIQHPDGKCEYHYPNDVQLVMYDCILKNSRSTALKIHSGESNKTVCAWVLCDRVEIRTEDFIGDNYQQVKYNPRVLPFWNRDGVDMDGSKVKEMYSVDYKLNIK
jgi:hypothetical protein